MGSPERGNSLSGVRRSGFRNRCESSDSLRVDRRNRVIKLVLEVNLHLNLQLR